MKTTRERERERERESEREREGDSNGHVVAVYFAEHGAWHLAERVPFLLDRCAGRAAAAQSRAAPTQAEAPRPFQGKDRVGSYGRALSVVRAKVPCFTALGKLTLTAVLSRGGS